MSSTLAVFGAGGHGRMVADSAEESGWSDVVFFDDRYPQLTSTLDWPVVGTLNNLLEQAPDFAGVVVGVGEGRARISMLDALARSHAALASIVHPRAWVSSRAEVAPGVVIAGGAIVNAGARIGRGAIINTGATVDHDCTIGRGVHIAPGAHVSGTVHVGDFSWIGVGASVRQDIRIGVGVIVGAGAAVVSDLPDGIVAIGVPACVKA